MQIDHRLSGGLSRPLSRRGDYENYVYSPAIANARSALRWQDLSAAAIVPLYPFRRSKPIAILDKEANTRGPFFTRICERSSSNVTSRTQCSEFSIDQCCLMRVNRSSCVTLSGDKLVIPYTVSFRGLLPLRSVTVRFNRNTCST